MLFNSPVYIFLFLPLAVAGYFLLNRLNCCLAGKIWLVSASLFFYGYWNPKYLILISISIVVNYFVGVGLNRTAASLKTPRKILLGAGVAMNLALLGYFKYADFFITNMNSIAGSEFPLLNIVLPLAISFFTFQQIAYLSDCYQTDTKEYDFVNYCLFVAFFPQLIAGPIVHHGEMMPQFMSPRNNDVNWHSISMGMFVFAIGLFKKVVIADSFSVWADAGFGDTAGLTFLDAWGAALSYSLQIYYDFSGYTDMAIGAALMFNIRLPINFNSPYKATSIREFWRRWHMTLSRWLRDYLYIPLGGNRGGDMRTGTNIILVFLLGGLWHGAGWTFVAWGSLHGFAVLVHRLWNRSGYCLSTFWGWLCTFLFITITWVFFRATTFQDAINVLQGMAGFNGLTVPENIQSGIAKYIDPESLPFELAGGGLQISIDTLIYLALFWMLALIMPNSVQLSGFIPYSGVLSFRVNYRFAIFTGLLLGISMIFIFTDNHPNEFLYFNF